jgi:hypothetical protein
VKEVASQGAVLSQVIRAAGVASLAAQLEEECLCSVCQDFVCRPMTLACGHTFCKKCLDDWLRRQRLAAMAPFCPMCRHEIGASKAVRNRALENVMERLTHRKPDAVLSH